VEEARLGDTEFVGEKGDTGFGGAGFKRSERLAKGQVKVEQRHLATLNRRAAQEMRLEGADG
jgi:hypothetical protein